MSNPSFFSHKYTCNGCTIQGQLTPNVHARHDSNKASAVWYSAAQRRDGSA